MSWIHIPEGDEVDPELAALWDRVRDRDSGQLDNIMAIHGLHPRGLAAHYGLYAAVMSGTKGLRKVDREMVALVVSQENGCHY